MNKDDRKARVTKQLMETITRQQQKLNNMAVILNANESGFLPDDVTLASLRSHMSQPLDDISLDPPEYVAKVEKMIREGRNGKVTE